MHCKARNMYFTVLSLLYRILSNYRDKKIIQSVPCIRVFRSNQNKSFSANSWSWRVSAQDLGAIHCHNCCLCCFCVLIRSGRLLFPLFLNNYRANRQFEVSIRIECERTQYLYIKPSYSTGDWVSGSVSLVIIIYVTEMCCWCEANVSPGL